MSVTGVIMSDLFHRRLDGLFGRVQHVADAAYGVNHLDRKFVVDLAAQMPDIHVDDVGESVVVHVPDVLDNHGAAQRTAAVAHQIFQDAEFLGRQLDVFVGARDFAADAIERQIAHLQAFRHGLAAAQKRPDASQ